MKNHSLLFPSLLATIGILLFGALACFSQTTIVPQDSNAAPHYANPDTNSTRKTIPLPSSDVLSALNKQLVDQLYNLRFSNQVLKGQLLNAQQSLSAMIPQPPMPMATKSASTNVFIIAPPPFPKTNGLAANFAPTQIATLQARFFSSPRLMNPVWTLFATAPRSTNGGMIGVNFVVTNNQPIYFKCADGFIAPPTNAY